MDRKTQVAAFFDAWRSMDPDKVAAWFTEDAVYDNIPMQRTVGRENIRSLIAKWLEAMSGLDFSFTHVLANDDVVLMERQDVVSRPNGESARLPIMGVIEFRGDLIAAWREYFDSAQMAALIAGGQ